MENHLILMFGKELTFLNVFSSCGLEQMAKTPAGSNGRLRPLKRCEEAQAPSRGKRSHLRK
ncbi:hypothetical protein FZC74_14315 [Sutcliffiella horikoshii]|uniref:Uncharacterized protein n=1 Tax=Sutcliffiella horikoshii TaxID=79883 RepID=A0AA94WPK9_9BACI|nr:hypothetical protein FZC74_14315 [Sutcliffiella horikoshii]